MTKVVGINSARKTNPRNEQIEAMVKQLLIGDPALQAHSGVEMCRYVGTRRFDDDSLVRELAISDSVVLDLALEGTLKELKEVFKVHLPPVPLIVFTSLIMSVVRTHRATSTDPQKIVNVAIIKENDNLLWLGLMYEQENQEIGLLFKFDLTYLNDGG